MEAAVLAAVDVRKRFGALAVLDGVNLALIMLSLPIKMYLRWIFNLKYIVSIPEFAFNI